MPASSNGDEKLVGISRRPPSQRIPQQLSFVVMVLLDRLLLILTILIGASLDAWAEVPHTPESGATHGRRSVGTVARSDDAGFRRHNCWHHDRSSKALSSVTPASDADTV